MGEAAITNSSLGCLTVTPPSLNIKSIRPLGRLYQRKGRILRRVRCGWLDAATDADRLLLHEYHQRMSCQSFDDGGKGEVMQIAEDLLRR
jgi:hypothetical protein